MTMRSATLKRFTVFISYALLLAALPLLMSACGDSSGGSSNPSVQPVGNYSFPTDITLSADGTRMYVANNVRNAVSIVDTASMGFIADIRVSCNPRHLALNEAASQLYVSHDNVSSCRLSPLPQLDTDPTTGYSGTKLTLIDLAANAAAKELRLNGMEQDGRIRSLSSARNMFWDITSERMYVTGLDSSSVAIIDTNVVDNLATYQVVFTEAEAGEVLGYIRDITQPVDIDMTSNGEVVVVPQPGANGLSLIDPTTMDEFDGSPWAMPSGCTKPSNPLIYKVSGDADADTYVFISCYSSDKVIVIDITDPTTPLNSGTIDVGDAPTVMYLTPNGETLLVLNSGAGTVTTVPWGDINSGQTENYGLLFSVRPGGNVNTLPSDMAVYGNTVYVSDMLANTITKFDYTNSFSSTAIVGWTAGRVLARAGEPLVSLKSK